MFYIIEILAGKESNAKRDYERLDSFDLAWGEFENWYFDNHILR